MASKTLFQANALRNRTKQSIRNKVMQHFRFNGVIKDQQKYQKNTSNLTKYIKSRFRLNARIPNSFSSDAFFSSSAKNTRARQEKMKWN